MGGDENTRRTSGVGDGPAGAMGRRRFVQTVSSLGVGAVAASVFATENVRAAGREKTIVYGFTRDSEHEQAENGGGNGGGRGDGGGGGGELSPRRKPVPADWYDDFRSALAAHRNLQVIHRDGVANSAVAPGEYGGANAAIHVEVTAEQARGEVPESVEDTPVEVRKVESASERGGRSADPPSAASVAGEGVPGSVAVASPKLYGTLAPAMQDPADGSRLFATANHIFDGADSRGDPLYLLDDEKREIGTVESGHPKADLACVRPLSGFQPLHRIEESDPGRVLGQFTKAGLADLKAAGEPLEKIGVKTGHTRGKIQAIDGMTCAYGAICKQGQLKWGTESGFGDGDSGSVNFHADPEDPGAGVLVGGFNNARTWWPGENYIWGTAAYHVTQQYGYTF